MLLVRALQRAEALQEDESLEKAWTSTLADLQARTAALFPTPGAPPPAPRGRGEDVAEAADGWLRRTSEGSEVKHKKTTSS